MTADNHPSLPSDGIAASSENSAPVKAPAKKSPSRKVAVRPKVSAIALEEVTSPAEKKAKVSRSRSKKVEAEPAAAIAPLSERPFEGPQAVKVAERAATPEIVAPAVMTTKAEVSANSNAERPVDGAARDTSLAGSAAPIDNKILPQPLAPEPQPVRAEAPSFSEAGSPRPDDLAAKSAPVLNTEVTQGNQSNEGMATTSNNNQGDERRFERGQPFQGRRGDHRQQGGRGDYQGRGNDHQQGRGDYQNRGNFQNRGDHQQQGRGGQQGFRQQGGGQQNHQAQGGGGQGQYSEQQRPDQQSQQGADGLVTRVTETQYGEGIIEVSGKGFGFLREAKRNFVQTPADIFVTPEVCRKYNLRDGQWIKGEIRRSSRGPQLFRLTALNNEDPEKFRNLPNFDELTSINPKKRIKLETAADRYTTRVMDLMTPIGKGQRGLIVAPPRTGKTTLLQHIAEAVVKNHPEVKLIILLVDERPEEVTEIRRSVPEAEIMASSNDSDLKSHTRIAQLAIERAKRLVEAGQDVFILLDSITRMARAFNNSMSGGGRGTASGGLAVGALEIPRKLFAAARNTEEAGSLTIMATALIETNSKMDDAIFQEFKGTGNMELVLDRKISDQRIYPAVDIFLSGTRREELLLQSWELDKINVIRRGLAGHKPIEAIERLLTFLKKFPTNTQMLASLPG